MNQHILIKSLLSKDVFKGSLIPTVMALIIFLIGCSSVPTSTSSSTADNSSYSKTTRQHEYSSAIEIAESLIGSPYHYGGANPDGFDCSGFIYYVYDKVGISMPRTTKDQYHQSRQLAFKKARPGDLLFFRTSSRSLSHVGLYTGGGQFIHVSSSRRQVIKTSLDNPYWNKRLISVGRIY